MGLISKGDVLSSPDLSREKVAVPEWGGDVLVSELSALELSRFFAIAYPASGEALRGPQYSAVLAEHAIVDESGARVFGDGELIGKSPKALARVAEVASRLSFATDEKREEVAKN